jgi:hypothetical protein
MEPRPADVVRDGILRGSPEARGVAPDRWEVLTPGGRVVLILVPEGPERTRIEVLVGRVARFRRSRRCAGEGWPVPWGPPGERPADAAGDWRLERVIAGP